jgi:hypothetical protein
MDQEELQRLVRESSTKLIALEAALKKRNPSLYKEYLRCLDSEQEQEDYSGKTIVLGDPK